MSGQDALRNNATSVTAGRAVLRRDLLTMADVFKASGYQELENFISHKICAAPERKAALETWRSQAASALREAGDLVNDGVEGIIVPPNDVDRLAEAILYLHQNRDVVARMSIAARARVVENFTWDHFRTRLLGGYERAMSSS